MPVVGKGTETLSTPEVVVRAQIFGNKSKRVGGATGPAADREAQSWEVADAGVTSNDGGNPITIANLNDINSDAQGLAYSFPGEPADDNSWTIDVAVPKYMATVPNMKIRLFLLADGAGTCGGPTPGGDGVFTGAQVASVSSSGQTISNHSQTQVDAALLDGTIFDTGVTQFGAAYWDSGTGRFVVPAGAGSADSPFIIVFEANWDISNSGYGTSVIVQGPNDLDFDYQIIDNNAYGCRIRMVAEAILADGDTVYVNVTQDTSGGATRDVTDGIFFIGRYDYVAP